MTSRKRALVLLLGAALWATASSALLAESPETLPDESEPRPPAEAYRIETVASGFEFPWALAFLPDGQLLVTERVGRLRLISADGRLLEEPVTGLPDMLLENQAGLLGLALAPDFAQSQRLFFSFVCGTAAANSVCLGTGRLQGSHLEGVRTIFQAQPPRPGARQYGGRIEVLPDNTLVLTLGDLYDFREAAQGLGNHLGKLVRLNQDGTVPADNPFTNRIGALPEILSFGHRNPLGIVYDKINGRLLSHENGAQGGDELNLIEPGANYGWPIVSYGVEYSGDQTTPYTSLPAFKDPLLHWTPSIAPSGMSHYDGALFPAWRGSLLVSALKGMGVHRVELTADGARDQEILFSELRARIRDVRTGPDGAVYLLTDSHEAQLLRVVPAGF